jgi:1-acyl-sn-glycerol-3-phosphate acyltransferase
VLEPQGSRLAPASAFIYSLTRFIARPIIFLLANMQVEGLENIPASGPVILAMNHIHWMDIPMASVNVPRVTHYMAKIELFSVPLLGGFIRMLGAFPVRRGEGDRDSIRISERILADGEILVIFPEGHRSGNGVLLQAHPGAGYIAMRTGAPVVAVAISGTQKVFKRFRPKVMIRYSRPFTMSAGDERRTRTSLAVATDQIMYQIAALLPPQSRGPYSEAPMPAPPAEAMTATDVLSPPASEDHPGSARR